MCPLSPFAKWTKHWQTRFSGLLNCHLIQRTYHTFLHNIWACKVRRKGETHSLYCRKTNQVKMLCIAHTIGNCSSISCSIVHRTLAAAVYRYRDLMQQPFKSHQTTRRGSTGTLTSVMSGITLPGLMQTPGIMLRLAWRGNQNACRFGQVRDGQIPLAKTNP